MMAIATDRKPLGQLLVGRGFVQPEQLDRALDEQRKSNYQKLLGEILVELRTCSEEQVAEALAESYGLPFVRVSPRVADPKVVPLLPKAFLEKHRVLPLFLVEGVLTVAVSEPADLFLREEIERATGLIVQVAAATSRDILATLQTYVPEDGIFVIDDVTQEVDSSVFALLDGQGAQREASESASPVAKLVNYCLYHAVRDRATDVLIEPHNGEVRVRYRIDGALIERMRPALAMHEPIIARLKQLAGLDPQNRTAPQDGTIRARIDRLPIELSVSAMPLRSGETIAIHIQQQERGVLRLEKLGFTYEMLKQWRRLLSLRSGLIVITGPAGSGKHTALYSALREMNAAEMNICTVEETIAAPLEGVRQLQLNGSGMDYAAGVQNMLKQRPDVLMVDHLGDMSPFKGALDAALAGRLVLAGITAPDTASAIARLQHMGAQPYSLGAALSGVLAQRLARRLCSSCKETYTATASERRQMEKWGTPLETLYRSRGCPQCKDTGYVGRIGIHELLVPDDMLVDRISQGTTLPELRELVKASGAKTLAQDGLEKLKSGLTTLAELNRAIA